MKEEKDKNRERVRQDEVPPEKPKIDKRKLIIYSEIMKPKFDEGLK